MGLDMSLYACRSMVFENDSIFDEIKKFITIPFPNATLNNIQVEVMSWRKANAIHNWFINNCTNGVKYQLIEKLRDEFLDMCNEAHLPNYCEWCYPTQVFIGQLVKLRDICKEVLDHSELVPAKNIDSYTYQLSPSGVLVEKANMVDGYVILDPTFARKHLPTIDGFFFGSTDYNQWYYEYVKYTYDGLNIILSIDPTELRNWNFLYEAIW